MRVWDYDARPYRPVEKKGYETEFRQGQWAISTDKPIVLQADVFSDALGRIWYAPTRKHIEALPADPTTHEKIPSEFWHPDYATRIITGRDYAA